MVITIDGPAGAGKSTVARMVAERLGYRYVDTGRMYRELTAVALARGVSLNDGEALAELVGIQPPADVDLRSEAISRNVSAASRHPRVRARMRALQRELAHNAVLEGRDTGSMVWPAAEVKVYLVAPVRVRAERRAADLAAPDIESVVKAISERDSLDSEQSAPAPDAHVIDTGGLSSDETVERVLALVQAAA